MKGTLFVIFFVFISACNLLAIDHYPFLSVKLNNRWNEYIYNYVLTDSGYNVYENGNLNYKCIFKFGKESVIEYKYGIYGLRRCHIKNGLIAEIQEDVYVSVLKYSDGHLRRIYNKINGELSNTDYIDFIWDGNQLLSIIQKSDGDCKNDTFKIEYTDTCNNSKKSDDFNLMLETNYFNIIDIPLLRSGLYGILPKYRTCILFPPWEYYHKISINYSIYNNLKKVMIKVWYGENYPEEYTRSYSGNITVLDNIFKK